MNLGMECNQLALGHDVLGDFLKCWSSFFIVNNEEVASSSCFLSAVNIMSDTGLFNSMFPLRILSLSDPLLALKQRQNWSWSCLAFHFPSNSLAHLNLGTRSKFCIFFASLRPDTGRRHCWSSTAVPLWARGSPALQKFCTALAPLLSRSGSLMALGSTTPSETAMGDSKSVFFLTQQMGCCLQKGNKCLCMAYSLTGMSGEALMLHPHKQLTSASSSKASWVTSHFTNSSSFLPHSLWMELFAGGFPALISSFLYSSAFSVVTVQLLTLKNGSLKYLG